MDKRQRSSSQRSVADAVVTFAVVIILLMGGCNQLEKNGTFDQWAKQMQKQP